MGWIIFGIIAAVIAIMTIVFYVICNVAIDIIDLDVSDVE